MLAQEYRQVFGFLYLIILKKMAFIPKGDVPHLKSVMVALLGIILSASACSRVHTYSPLEQASRSAGEQTQGQHASAIKDVLAGLTIRDLLADTDGHRLIVQDANMSLFEVSATGRQLIGKAPQIGVVADWRLGGDTYALARETTENGVYEIVEIHGGNQRVRVTATGFPNAVHYSGGTLYLIDAEGLKEISDNGTVSKLGSLPLGLTNRSATCFWGTSLPMCVGGYGIEDADHPQADLTLVRPGDTPIKLTGKGTTPIIVDAAFSLDGRRVAVALWPRFNSATDSGRVVMVTLDEVGNPVAVREYPIRSSHVDFDNRGRLLVYALPPDSGWGSIGILNQDTGAVTPLQPDRGTGTFVMSRTRDRIYILPGPQGGILEDMRLP